MGLIMPKQGSPVLNDWLDLVSKVNYTGDDDWNQEQHFTF